MPEHVEMRAFTREQRRSHSKRKVLELEPIRVRPVPLLGLAQEIALFGRKNICSFGEFVFGWHELVLSLKT
jgi:hypothetical protein